MSFKKKKKTLSKGNTRYARQWFQLESKWIVRHWHWVKYECNSNKCITKDYFPCSRFTCFTCDRTGDRIKIGMRKHSFARKCWPWNLNDFVGDLLDAIFIWIFNRKLHASEFICCEKWFFCQKSKWNLGNMAVSYQVTRISVGIIMPVHRIQ